MKLTLVFKTVDVDIDGKPYVLKEMDGVQREAFRKMVEDNTIIEEGKPAGVKDQLALKMELLGKCLTPGPSSTWPGQVLEALFKAAQEMNGLTKESRGNS